MTSASYYHGNYPSKPPLIQPATYSEMQTFDPTNSKLNSYMAPPPPQQQQYTPLDPTTPSPPPPPPHPTASIKPPRVSRKRFESLKRTLRVLHLIATLTSTILNAVMFSLMTYVNIKFYTTRSHISQDHRAWPAKVKQWPSLMLLVAALITLSLSLVLLLLNRCQNCRKSKKPVLGQKEKIAVAAEKSWKVTVLKYAIQICVWATVSTLYRYEKSLHGHNNDLWGWSCANKSNAVQAAFDGQIDFGGLCTVQVCPPPPYPFFSHQTPPPPPHPPSEKST